MQKDKHKTKVIFRKYKKGDVIALFPDEIANNNSNWLSYQHIGQYDAADYTSIIRSTKLATPNEYKALKKALESIGYNLEVRKRK